MKAKKKMKRMKTIKMLSKKRDRSTKSKEPCFFLEKLYNILQDKKNNNIIKWNEDGTKIIILDSIKFANTILPKNFKHGNYSSFVRQLNIYGFHKIANIYKSKKEEFFNEFFKRDNSIEKIRNIRRKDLIDDNNEDSDQIILLHLNEINKEKDDEKKIEEYKKMIKNGNMNIKSNIHILEFLFKKNKERDIFYDKIKNEISELINNNIIDLQNMKNNLLKNERNAYFINNIVEKKESFTLNENIKLLNAFKNATDNIIEKKNKNNALNTSFVDDLSMFEGNSKTNLNANPQSQVRTSYILLNKSGILIDPKLY